ncbi:flavin reductase family protein [Mesorhizobium sp.]|uniref:flavin reductase family protein n=1 Tax=Mesorhizobium sp. TaxID=1871066 RepID=UPI00338D6D17
MATGALVLQDALAAVDCTVEDTIVRHSHVVVLGSVRHVVSGEPGPALIYHHGAYGSS